MKQFAYFQLCLATASYPEKLSKNTISVNDTFRSFTTSPSVQPNLREVNVDQTVAERIKSMYQFIKTTLHKSGENGKKMSKLVCIMFMY